MFDTIDNNIMSTKAVATLINNRYVKSLVSKKCFFL